MDAILVYELDSELPEGRALVCCSSGYFLALAKYFALT